jgi:propanol-preferring alcohol dehydrogenase
VHAVDGDWPAPTKLPLVPGHEGAGVVVAVGPGVSSTVVSLGDRVGIPWLHSSCGSCEFCLSGRENLCPLQDNTGYSVDGCFAQYVLAPAAHLAKIPDEVSFEQVRWIRGN